MSMARGHGIRRAAMIGAVGLSLLVAVPSVLGGTGIGAVFNLGRTNKVNASTALTGTTISKMLGITNSGSGVALQLTTRSNVPPMRVNSQVRVANLNADLLDGLNASAFMAANARPDADTLDGLHASAFMAANARPDADTLDGLDSTAFMAANAHPDAATVQGLDAAALTAPGDIYQTYGPSGWQVHSMSSDGVIRRYLSTVRLGTTVATSNAYVLSLDAPVYANGWAYGLKSAELCVGSYTYASITGLRLYSYSPSNSGTPIGEVDDTTTRTTPGCYTLTLAQPAVGGITSLYVAATQTDPTGTVFVTGTRMRWVPVTKSDTPPALSSTTGGTAAGVDPTLNGGEK